MFLGTFAWSFVYVSLPFHILEMSPLDPAATLAWTGWILGIANLATVVVAPFWGRFAERGDTKRLYVATQGLQGVAFFGMALARTLPELFVSRLVLGVIGASSTFAFVNAGRSADAAEIRRQVAAVQSGMTIGQIIGPLVGAIAAARLGFRPSFVVGGLILWGCGALALWGLPAPTEPREGHAGERLTRVRDVVAVALVVLGASTQVFFLTSILPQILPDLGVAPEQTLEVGGILIFVSGVAAAIGALVTGRLARLFAERRLLVTLLCAASALQAALAVAHSVWLYGVVRFLQILCIAPVFPLVVGRIAQSAGGGAVGLVNSARIGAAFVGPVMATTILAWTSPALLYLVLAALGLACLPLVMLGYQEAAA